MQLLRLSKLGINATPTIPNLVINATYRILRLVNILWYVWLKQHWTKMTLSLNGLQIIPKKRNLNMDLAKEASGPLLFMVASFTIIDYQTSPRSVILIICIWFYLYHLSLNARVCFVLLYCWVNVCPHSENLKIMGRDKHLGLNQHWIFRKAS